MKACPCGRSLALQRSLSVSGHSVDGPHRGTSPRLWDIKVQVPPMFQEDTRKFQVPHSSLVKVTITGIFALPPELVLQPPMSPQPCPFKKGTPSPGWRFIPQLARRPLLTKLRARNVVPFPQNPTQTWEHPHSRQATHGQSGTGSPEPAFSAPARRSGIFGLTVNS